MTYTSDASMADRMRGALDDVCQLTRRLTRTAHLADMREKYIGAAAAAAVAIGAGLAFAAWRRARRDRDLIHGVVMYERPIPADVICD
jgi:hypothetical protein